MANHLRAKFKEWVFIFVLLPATVSMLLCNFVVWKLLRQSYYRSIQDNLTHVHAAFEQLLRTEEIRLKSIAEWPTTKSLLILSERRLSQRQAEQADDLETRWGEAERDDLLIRGILDNDVGNFFRDLCRQYPHLLALYLTDDRGRLMASSHLTSHYYQTGEAWWSITQNTNSAMTANLSADGILFIVHPLGRSASSRKKFLCAKIDAAQLLSFASTQTLKKNPKTMIALIGSTNVLTQGAANLYSKLPQDVSRHSSETARAEGIRYVTRPVVADMEWATPLRILFIQEESFFPVAYYGPLFLFWLCGIGFVLFVYFAARDLGRKLFFEPMLDVVDAGLWTLKKAFGHKKTHATRSNPEPSWATLPVDGVTPLQESLNRWFDEHQKQLQEESLQIIADMRKDLALATEFQQAFFHRPYPQVPAVHVEGRLRLVFNHRYRPALAVGGDFFEIEALDSDCAGIFVADVMGHGLRSALITAMIRTLLSKLYKQGRNPVLFLKELNKMYCGMLKNFPQPLFSTAVYFVVDTTARAAVYALAGHPPPFYLHRSTGRVTLLPAPMQKGAALGLIPGEEYAGHSLRLHPDDVFIFFTDGTYEATNSRGEQFGIPRLEAALRKNIYKSVDDILDGLMQEITAFVGNAAVCDDICLVALEVTTTPLLSKPSSRPA